MEPDAMILVFWMLSFKPNFSLFFTFIERLFSSSLVSAIRVVSSAYLKVKSEVVSDSLRPHGLKPSPSVGFSRQGYRSGLPFPSPVDLPAPGIQPESPTLREGALPSEPTGKILPGILIPYSASSSPAFLLMYSAYKVNKQGDNIQPWCTPLPIWNQSVVQCPVLTVASWPAYRFLRRQVRWSGIPSL